MLSSTCDPLFGAFQLAQAATDCSAQTAVNYRELAAAIRRALSRQRGGKRRVHKLAMLQARSATPQRMPWVTQNWLLVRFG